MNVNLQHDFLDHHAIAETGKQHADGLEDQDDTHQKETEIFCDRCTKSSSENEFNELAINKANSQSLESHDSSVRNTSVQHKSCSRRSSKQLRRSRNHEKLTTMIQELKQYLPTEKVESCTKTSTLRALSYAAKCVQRVQDSKAFQCWGECGSYQTDASVHGIKELAVVTSEHTPKNADTFVAVFSLLSGKMVYVSEQAASILCCKKRLLDTSHFVELLAPQDVGVFYTHTSQSVLPLWNMEAQTESVYEYAQVKSFFCRISFSNTIREKDLYHCPHPRLCISRD